MKNKIVALSNQEKRQVNSLVIMMKWVTFNPNQFVGQVEDWSNNAFGLLSNQVAEINDYQAFCNLQRLASALALRGGSKALKAFEVFVSMLAKHAELDILRKLISTAFSIENTDASQAIEILAVTFAESKTKYSLQALGLMIDELVKHKKLDIAEKLFVIFEEKVNQEALGVLADTLRKPENTHASGQAAVSMAKNGSYSTLTAWAIELTTKEEYIALGKLNTALAINRTPESLDGIQTLADKLETLGLLSSAVIPHVVLYLISDNNSKKLFPEKQLSTLGVLENNIATETLKIALINCLIDLYPEVEEDIPLKEKCLKVLNFIPPDNILKKLAPNDLEKFNSILRVKRASP